MPAEWVDTVQRAVDANRYTVQRIPMRELAVQLTEVVEERIDALRAHVERLEQLRKS